LRYQCVQQRGLGGGVASKFAQQLVVALCYLRHSRLGGEQAGGGGRVGGQFYDQRAGVARSRGEGAKFAQPARFEN
jgi:hypothetical protein